MVDRSNVLLQGVVGSTAYGLAHDDSDIDQLGIYCAPIDYVLGLNGSTDLEHGSQNVDDSLVKHEPDLTLHEVGKYVRLALSANPTILELLYLDDYTIITPSGKLLVECRDSFLSSGKVKARYGGYARAQAERLMRNHEEGGEGFSSDVRNRTAKHGRHCMRLLRQGAQLLREGTMTVNVSEHRDKLFAAGERAAQAPEAFFEEAMEELERFDDIDSVLPEAPNRDEVEDLLIAIRLYEGVGAIVAMTGLIDPGV